ncbi:hypothetical protein SAMN04487983_11091 [Streptomyces sp. yr375]|uniref:hypothetical protein n=1 Tax=Streptomyces sp. yr375 TaxID=1761906 RepID=UPI0008C4B7FC|nr:hypothetical protein [Streptomyces sp. yr375]SES50099.1 hypothetical protein SAMN04487983_11091 [Streptomyces sp. yr375]
MSASKGKVRSVTITASSISGASITTGILGISYWLGPTTAPGKMLMFAAPWAVLFLPYVIAAVLNVMDGGLDNWQTSRHRARMVKIANLQETEEDRQDAMAEVKKSDMETLRRIRQKMRGVDEKSPQE